MLKHLFFLLFACMAVILPINCSHSSRFCDPELEAWATETKAIYESESPDAFILLPLSKQRTLYSKMSPEFKLSLWQRRLKEETCLKELSEVELAEYADMIDALRPEMFKKPDSKEILELTNKWIYRMKSVYNWDEYKISKYVLTWLTGPEFENALMLQAVSERKAVRDSMAPCDCKYGIACLWMTGTGYCNKNVSCTDRVSCGMLGNSFCDGLCEM